MVHKWIWMERYVISSDTLLWLDSVDGDVAQSTSTQASGLSECKEHWPGSSTAVFVTRYLYELPSKFYHLCTAFFTLRYGLAWLGLDWLTCRNLSGCEALPLWHLNRSVTVPYCCTVSTGCYLLWREFGKQSYHGQRALARRSGALCLWVGGSDCRLWNCLWTRTFQLPPDSSQEGKNHSSMHSSITLVLPALFSLYFPLTLL